MKTQIAALCYRGSGKDKEVLLITSRDTGRWIVPKGWPMKNRTLAQAALQEAWEEAGVKDGDVTSEVIGRFFYDKRYDSKDDVPIETLVFGVKVNKLSKTYPEVDEREREWVKPAVAANMVQEPELQSLIRSL